MTGSELLARGIRTLRGAGVPEPVGDARRLLAQALAHRTGEPAPALEPLDDELEAEAHEVSSARAHSRGVRY